MEHPAKRRWRLIALTGLAIGSLLAIIWFFAMPPGLNPGTGADGTATTVDETADTSAVVTVSDDFDPTVADPTFSPEEVVRLQLASLHEAAEHPERLVECFSLASPENRLNTGPLSRFAELIRDKSYFPLLGHQNAMIGRAKVIDGHAVVMATIVAVDDKAYSFEFLLSRYRPTESTSGPLIADAAGVDERQPVDDAGMCWMTDGVYPVFVADVPPASRSGTEE
ncbi:MAG: hypothetical protein WBD31_13745 [Rubripirellula sp.]